MKFILQELHNTEYILLVSEQKETFERDFYRLLSAYPSVILPSSEIPSSLSKYAHIFLFNTAPSQNQKKNLREFKGKICIIVTRKELLADIEKKTKSLAQVRIVLCPQQKLSKKEIEKIVWFAVSSSSKRVLYIIPPYPPPPIRNRLRLPHVTKGKAVRLVIFAFIFLECFFLLPLLTSSILLYKAGTAFKQQDSKKTEVYLRLTSPFLQLSKRSYQFSRPFLSFFFLALASDSVVDAHILTYDLLKKGTDTRKSGQKMLSLILQSQKSPARQKETARHADILRQNISALSQTASSLSAALDNIPLSQTASLKEDVDAVNKSLASLSRLTPFLDDIIGAGREKKYILFFYNNMELRPGGGFIGSFGIVRFKDYSLKELTIYNVYDADGQLTTHIEPPKAISTYLNQTHWFLRDSNFSPDFPQNVDIAESILEKEMGFSEFDGAVGITTTGISNLLDAFGPLYLPDYKETITKDNFYIKTQLYSEKDFFPGSAQKKDFLSSLARMMLLNLEDISFSELGKGVKRDLTEKHIVLHFSDLHLQQVIEKEGWSGKIIVPQCAFSKKNCQVTTLFPIDANLGVNKANFFVSRLIHITTEFSKDRSIKQTVAITFKNNSPPSSFPGGTYRNYFRLLFPQNAHINLVQKDGKTISDWNLSDIAYFNVFSTFIEIAPKTETTLTISYDQDISLSSEDVYQLAVQKQIGLVNSNLALEFRYPQNLKVKGINFTALEKKGKLFYNTHLSTDKLFLIDLKE